MFNFQEEKQEEQCPICTAVEEYVSIALSTNSRKQLFEVLHHLYEDAFEAGIVEQISRDIEAKMNLLDMIQGNCDCKECDC